MGLLEQFEETHGKEFNEVISWRSTPSFRTPDGREWHLSEIITSWQKRVSDKWGHAWLHAWIMSGKVEVRYYDLPCELMSHRSDDPAWQHIEREFGPGEREPLHQIIGRGDFRAGPLIVEFGTVPPAKFALNVGTELCFDHMIVPYGCKYAFVFIPKELLIGFGGFGAGKFRKSEGK